MCVYVCLDMFSVRRYACVYLCVCICVRVCVCVYEYVWCMYEYVCIYIFNNKNLIGINYSQVILKLNL